MQSEVWNGPVARDGAVEPAGAPTFLVGSERSGSTLLRLMLDHHPLIAFEHEFDIATLRVGDDGRMPEVDDAYVAWLGTVRGMWYSIDRTLGHRELMRDFLEQKRDASGGKPQVGATVHHHFDRLRFLWPDARFLHLLRDPRDVAPSVVQKGWAGNVYHATDWWTEAERCWDTLRARMDPEQLLEVRYEDLVRDPEAELTRICDFIGVEFDARMLRYHESVRQYPPPDPRLAFQWRKKLIPDQVALVEERAGEQLLERGYAPSGYPIPSIGPARRELLMLDSRAKRFRFRLDQFGPGIVALDLIGRRLGLRPVARYALERIKAVEDRLLEEEGDGKRAPSANIPVASGRRLDG